LARPTTELPRQNRPPISGAPERCQSGRSGRSRKPLCVQAYRGFESHPLRHFPPKDAVSWRLFRQRPFFTRHRTHHLDVDLADRGARVAAPISAIPAVSAPPFGPRKTLVAETLVAGWGCQRRPWRRSSFLEGRQIYATTLLSSVKRTASSPGKIILAYRHRGRGRAARVGRTP
jgi:hypothetical protein